jgi:hypothetical protein
LVGLPLFSVCLGWQGWKTSGKKVGSQAETCSNGKMRSWPLESDFWWMPLFRVEFITVGQNDAEERQRIAREKRCTGLGGCKDLTIGLKSRGPALPAMIQIQSLSQRLPGWVHMIMEVVKAPGIRSLIRVVFPSIHQCEKRLQRFFPRATQAPSDSD